MSPGRTKPSLRRKLLAALLSSLASLVAAEVVVRVAVGSPLAERLPLLRVRAHPTRGWEMIPGEDHYTYHHRAHVNALGLRGPEVGPREPGERRVVALGDSLIYGQGVADDETLSWFLERELEERDPAGRPWTVVNGGLRAYATHQELALLEELGPSLRPDVVVLFWFCNDLRERDVPGTFERLSASGPIVFDTGNRLAGLDALAWHAKQLVRRSALAMWLYDRVAIKESDVLTSEPDAGVLPRVLEHFERFRADAGELGFEPFVCVVPEPGEVGRSEPSRRLDERALLTAREAGLPALDLFAPLRPLFQGARRPPIVPFDGHYAAPANEAMGAAVAEWLLGHLAETHGSPPGVGAQQGAAATRD